MAILALALGVWALIAPSSAVAWPGQGGGPPAQCCDPADEPGVNGNPFCFEGHTCCVEGWRCNNADTSPSCRRGLGEVCP